LLNNDLRTLSGKHFAQEPGVVRDHDRPVRIVGKLRTDSFRHPANGGKGELVRYDGSPSRCSEVNCHPKN
jgi:hypothetical protein